MASGKVLIIYKSRYNSTKTYAEWIHNEVDSDIKKVEDVTNEDLISHSIIVFGSWIINDRIAIAGFVKNNWHILHSKKLVLFSVGLTQPEDPTSQDIFKNSFPVHIRRQIEYFPLWGRVKFSVLNFIEKFRLKREGKYKEIDEISQEKIRPIIVKLYGLKVFG